MALQGESRPPTTPDNHNNEKKDHDLDIVIAKMRNLHPRRGNGNDATYDYFRAIPTQDIGHIRLSANDEILYPDWHMLTPAYNIGNSGYTCLQLVTSLVEPGHPNNFKNRIVKLLTEDRYITYTNYLDKASLFINMLIIALVITLAVLTLYTDSTEQYVFNENAKITPTDQSIVDALNKQAGYAIKWIKLSLTGALAMISLYNIFKRTTTPHPNTKVKDFKKNGIVEKTKRQFLNQLDRRTPQPHITRNDITSVASVSEIAFRPKASTDVRTNQVLPLGAINLSV